MSYHNPATPPRKLATFDNHTTDWFPGEAGF